jgi:hypothetical protein
MRKTWPGSITNSNDIELRVGSLQALFLTRNDEWLIALFLSFIPFIPAVPVFYAWLMFQDWKSLWWVWLAAFSVSCFLWGLVWWYRRQRKFFAICTEGCAFAASQIATPVTIPWNEVKTIQLEEDASLSTEEHAYFGITTSKTMKQITRRSLRVRGNSDEIVFKLNEFPEASQLLDSLIEQTSDKSIELDHSRQESPELVAAKQAGHEDNFGKTKMTAFGIVLVILFIVIKVAIGLRK